MSKARQQANLSSDGNLFADISNDRVGVGSVVPTHKLHVNGTSKFDDDVKFEGTTAALNVDWDKSANTLNFSDNTELTFGDATNGDLRILHNSTNSIIKNTTGNLFLYASSSNIGLKLEPTAKVRLYYNGDAKFETSDTGAKVLGNLEVTGVLTYEDVTSVDSVGIVTARDHIKITTDNKSLFLGASDDFQLFHNGSHNIIKSNNGNLYLQDDDYIEIGDTSGKVSIGCVPGGATNLRHNGTTKLSTDSNGVSVTGRVFASGNAGYGFLVDDNVKIAAGTGKDLQIYHSGSENRIEISNGNFFIDAVTQNEIMFTHDSKYMLRMTPDNLVRLYYDGNLKLSTTSSGVSITGDITISDKIIHDGDTDTAIRFPAADTIQFETGGGVRAQIGSGSDYILRLNNTNSTKRFSVKETTTSSGVYYNAHITGGSHLANYAIGIGFDPEGYAARNKIGIVAEGTGAGYSRGKLHFLLDSANDSGEATLAESRMTITDAGNVGINESSPQRALHIGAGGVFRFERGDGTRYGELWNDNSFVELKASTDPIRINGQSYIRLDIADSEKVRIDSSGNILLSKGAQNTLMSNTSDGSDNQSIFVGGGGAPSDTRGAYIWAKGNEYTTTGGYLQLNAGNVGTAPITFSTGGGERVRITSGGYMGINTTSPQRYLHIVGNDGATGATIGNSDTQLVIDNIGTNGAIFEFLSSNTGAGRIMFTDTDGTNRGRMEYVHNGDYLRFYTASSERLRIDSSGDLLLGLTSFSGFAGADRRFVMNGTASSRMEFGVGGSQIGGFYADANQFIMYTAGSDILRFDVGGQEKLRIKTDGTLYAVNKIGCTTSTPFSRLQVGSHTFSGGNGMHADDRVGMSNHGNLTGLMLASTYNDASHPEYGVVFVQGASTSSYNVWSISPDGPAKGNSLNLHYGAQNTNIHAPGNRKFEFTGDGYFLSPNQVSFNAGIGADTTSASNYMIFTTAYHNIGGCYNTSNGIFTAPVAGTYIFTITGLYTKNNSSATWKLVWAVNNSNKGVAGEWQTSVFNNSYNTIGQSSIIYSLAANDTVRLQVHGSSFHVSGQQTRFCGHLLG